MPFAQLVIGPPGAGKSTYCDGVQQFFTAIDRECAVVNLDPANDRISYSCDLDIRDLVPLEDVMSEEGLGPNGGVLYALEELEHNWGWMEERLAELKSDYLVIDCPGQVELFTHHSSLPTIFRNLEKLNYRLVVVQLLDSHTITRPTLYVSSLLLCLRAMLNLPYPLVNVLTKIDNLNRTAEPLPFNLDFYAEVQDLSYLLPHLEAEQAGVSLSELASDPTVDAETVLEGIRARDPYKAERVSRWTKLNEALIQLVEDFGLVGFETLAVEDKASMTSLIRAIDRAGGYVFGADGKGGLSNEEGVFASAMKEGWGQMDIRDVQERWIDRREEFDELERKQWEEEAKIATANAASGVEMDGVETTNDTAVTTAQHLEQSRRTKTTSNDPDDDEDLEKLQADFMKSRAEKDATP